MAALWSNSGPGFYHWPSLVLLILCTVARTYSDSSYQGCYAVRNAYGAKGFDKQDVPSKMMSGEHLRICPTGFTCCTQDMEHKLSTESRQDYDRSMADKIGLLRNIFITRTAKFDAFFTELLDNSKQDLHDMFVRTYGLLYQQNSYVFMDLFQDLRNYYKGKDTNLLDALDNFFSILLQKMFELLNAQYTFDEPYLQCVSDQMDSLKPFGDVPQKLSVQVKRAFVAARTFVQGLAVGRDVILAVSKVQPSLSCTQGLMKMLYCPYCRGLPQVKPCNNYCMNIMKGCLAHHSELNKEWNQYISALMKVAERMEGPFNIEAVVDPIDVKISDAIMNFQENNPVVSAKIFTECGEPQFSHDRHRREAKKKQGRGDSENNQDDYSFGWTMYDGRKEESQPRPTTAAGTSLDRLVRDIKEKVAIAKDFWKGLPDSICNEMAAPVQEETNCWNGLAKARYMPEVMSDGLVHQNNNPEVEVDIRKPNFVITQQKLQLRLITNKLRLAFQGQDVEWVDTADVVGSGMSDGGGSGSGSGGDQDDSSGDGSNGHNMSDDISFPRSSPKPPKLGPTRKPPMSSFEEINYVGDSAGFRISSSCILVALGLLFTVLVNKIC